MRRETDDVGMSKRCAAFVKLRALATSTNKAMSRSHSIVPFLHKSFSPNPLYDSSSAMTLTSWERNAPAY
jgi:hypothetical protein